MGLWSQDEQPTYDAFLAEIRAQQAQIADADEAPTPGGLTGEAPELMTDDAASSDTDDVAAETVSIDTVFTHPTAPFDVPATVAPGIYRAANHRGETRMVVVPSSDSEQSARGRDFYTLEVGEDRWYLIRVDVSVANVSDSATRR